MRVRDYADIYTLTPDWPVDHGVAREAAPEDVRRPIRPGRHHASSAGALAGPA